MYASTASCSLTGQNQHRHNVFPFVSVGVCRYSLDNTGKPKLVVEVEPDIVGLARALTPIHLNRQKYAPHISVVRKENPPNMERWGAYEGKCVTFNYCSYVYDDGVYYWINAIGQELENIRRELGLPPKSRLSKPPDGADVFHITIGNLKKP